MWDGQFDELNLVIKCLICDIKSIFTEYLHNIIVNFAISWVGCIYWLMTAQNNNDIENESGIWIVNILCFLNCINRSSSVTGTASLMFIHYLFIHSCIYPFVSMNRVASFLPILYKILSIYFNNIKLSMLGKLP